MHKEKTELTVSDRPSQVTAPRPRQSKELLRAELTFLTAEVLIC